MTLRDYWELLRRSWLLILGTTIAGALAASAWSMATPAAYQSQAQVFVSVQSLETAQYGDLYVPARVKSYVELVDSPAVLNPVIEELDLDLKYPQLAAQVSALNPTQTVLLNVLATDANAEQSAVIADATAKSLTREIVRLETTDSGEKPVSAEVIRPAQVPTTPLTPRTRLNIVLGAMLGLMVGSGIAILRESLNSTVRTTAGLEAVTGAASLGMIPLDPQADRAPLITGAATPRSEAYRTLRTNLLHIDVDNPLRTIVLTSSTTDEGKTTSAINLAIALAGAGSRVLLIDADLRRPRLADYLEMTKSVGLAEVLLCDAALEEAIVGWREGLTDVLPSGATPPNPSELLESRRMADLLVTVTGRYEVTLLNCPPLGAVADAAILASAVDGALLVACHGATHYEDVRGAAESLHRVGARLIGTILTFTPPGQRAGHVPGHGRSRSSGNTVG